MITITGPRRTIYLYQLHADGRLTLTDELGRSLGYPPLPAWVAKRRAEEEAGLVDTRPQPPTRCKNADCKTPPGQQPEFWYHSTRNRYELTCKTCRNWRVRQQYHDKKPQPVPPPYQPETETEVEPPPSIQYRTPARQLTEAPAPRSMIEALGMGWMLEEASNG